MAVTSYVMRQLPCPECGEPFWQSVDKDYEFTTPPKWRSCEACTPTPAPEHLSTIHFGAEFQPYYHSTLGHVVTSTRDFDKQCEAKGLYCLGGDVRRELDSISRNKPDEKDVLSVPKFRDLWQETGQKYGFSDEQVEDDD